MKTYYTVILPHHIEYIMLLYHYRQQKVKYISSIYLIVLLCCYIY